MWPRNVAPCKVTSTTSQNSIRTVHVSRGHATKRDTDTAQHTNANGAMDRPTNYGRDRRRPSNPDWTLCVHNCVEIYIGICIDMFMDMFVGMFTDMFTDMFVRLSLQRCTVSMYGRGIHGHVCADICCASPSMALDTLSVTPRY